MNFFRQLVVQSEEKLKDREVFPGVTHPDEWRSEGEL